MSITIQTPGLLQLPTRKTPARKSSVEIPAQQEVLFAAEPARDNAAAAGRALLTQRGPRFGNSADVAQRPVIPPGLLSDDMKKALIDARKAAEKPGMITLEHVLLALLENKDTAQAFKRLLINKYKIAPEKFEAMLRSSIEPLKERTSSNASRQPRQDAEFAEAFRAMHDFSIKEGTPITTDTLMMAALSLPEGRVAKLKSSLTVNSIAKDEDEEKILQQFFRDVTFEAEIGKLPPIIGRDEELINTITTMAQSKKASVVYTGPAGVGKTATIEKLAQLNATGWKEMGGNIPDLFQQKDENGDPILSPTPGADGKLEMKPVGKRTLELNLSLLANPQMPPDEKDAIIKFALRIQDRCDIYIDELHVLNRPENSALANQLKPYLAREFKIIGATTDDEFRKILAKDPALERRFTPVRVDEPSVEKATTILRGSKAYFEKSHGVSLRDDALQVAAEKAKRYLSKVKLPDSAITLVDKTCARLKIENQIGSFQVLKTQSELRELAINLDGISTRLDELNADDRTLSSEFNKIITSVYEGLLKKYNDDDFRNGDSEEAAKFRALNFGRFDDRDDTLKNNLLKAVNKEALATDPAAQLWREYLEKHFPFAIDKAKHYAKRSKELSFALDEAKKEQKRLNTLERALKDRLQTEQKLEIRPIVTVKDILQTVEEMTGTPVSQLEEDEMEKLQHMETELGKRVIGQKQAIKAISDKVRSNRMGNGDPRKPIGTFLLPGPTGVGKTELAKALAAYLFDDEKAMTRIDMSEYMEKHTVARLVGAPPGYVGYDEGGTLTNAVKDKPYQVVLFDEVEKAHPDVWNIMLQIMDDGRLTDGQGNTVDFKDTVILYTTNLGSALLLKPFKDRGTNGDMDPDSQAFKDACADMQKISMNTLKKGMKPEVLNRFQDIIACHPLMNAHLQKIVGLIINRVNKGFQAGNIKVKVELAPDARDYLIQQGANFEMGARPLERTIDKKIKEPINDRILSGEYHNGDTIEVTKALIQKWEEEAKSKV